MTEPTFSAIDEPIVAEWLYLSDRAQQIYGGLVGLSDFGHWDTYFARTFDIYTRLWRFQQQHRSTLENKEIYGLQRWEIGDIATRIAQLYYHYYLRTSDVSYLQEAFLFYEAVRQRHYYRVPEKSKNTTALLVKQLRFYARFVVTCLLLDRKSLVNQLVGELTELINEYSTLVKATGETQEWHLVLQEINLFLHADVTVHIKDPSPEIKRPTRRTIFPSRPSLSNASSPSGTPPLRLQSCILVGSHVHQVKFSELTLDMYRMMYSLERDPGNPLTNSNPGSTASSSISNPSITTSATITVTSATGATNPATTTAASIGTPRSKSKSNPITNPKKFLLYRPPVSQLLLYLASAQRELGENGVLLLYISADGEEPKSIQSTSTPSSTTSSGLVAPPSSLSSTPLTPLATSPFNTESHLSSNFTAENTCSSSHTFDGFSCGGARLRSEHSPAPPVSAGSTSGSSPNHYTVSPKAFYPIDLVPFLRRPLFLIVDSDNSHAFLNLNGSPFGIPLAIMVSPHSTPNDLLEQSQAGSLFTWFLHDPLSAFLFTSSKNILPQFIYEQCISKMNGIISGIDELFANSNEELPLTIHQFCNDEYFRMYFVRFVFCHMVLKLRCQHFESPEEYLPTTNPPVPQSILGHTVSIQAIKELAASIAVSSLYS